MNQVSKNIYLQNRELHHVIKFWEMSKDKQLQTLFPFQNQTLEEAIELYHQSLLPMATSYGKTIYHWYLYWGCLVLCNR